MDHRRMPGPRPRHSDHRSLVASSGKRSDRWWGVTPTLIDLLPGSPRGCQGCRPPWQPRNDLDSPPTIQNGDHRYWTGPLGGPRRRCAARSERRASADDHWFRDREFGENAQSPHPLHHKERSWCSAAALPRASQAARPRDRVWSGRARAWPVAGNGLPGSCPPEQPARGWRNNQWRPSAARIVPARAASTTMPEEPMAATSSAWSDGNDRPARPRAPTARRHRSVRGGLACHSLSSMA